MDNGIGPGSGVTASAMSLGRGTGTRTDSPDQQQSENTMDDGASSEAALACNCCRKRKLRCSREVPTCQQCRKTGSECVYETKRAKPGMKAGAIENLHRRLDALERTVSQQASRPPERDPAPASLAAPPSGDASRPDGDRNPYDILSFFARELQRFNNERPDVTPPQPPRHDERRPLQPRVKRRRGDSSEDIRVPIRLNVPSLPDGDVLDGVLRAYFAHVHPWIPMIHEGRFRRRLADPDDHPRLHVILHSMILVASRYIEDVDSAVALTVSREKQEQVRDWIIAQAMRDLSVENLQALTMVAFNDIGNGEGSQAWSLIGSLTRTVEYLQLTIEHEDTERLSLTQPFASLAPAQDWTETEERRRVFWNVFNLDRFCSVTMGWNTSLTSDDVNRRLPCDGFTWRKEDPVQTPYFGIWDKGAGRIGNPIAFFPSHYVAPSSSHVKDEEIQTPSETGASPAGGPAAAVDMSAVGAFAYSIEATESLSRVNSYFLQQKVNMQDHRDLTSWLTRFKEMDLRLVHWKMFLPQKWKANMARQSSRMDPNLTLAHVTHNASMILLHQVMAFPPPEWSFRNRLPSILSEDTCKAAAMEIATITQNYLKNAPPTVPVSSAFAFCLYVAAKVLLSKWRYTTREDLAPDFWCLVQSLEEMARRWVGPHGLDNGRVCLAAKYAQKLTESYHRCVSDEHFRISGLGYTNEIDHSVVRASRDVEGHSGRDQTNGANPMRQLAVPTSHAAQGTSGFRPPPPPPPAAAAVPSPTGPGPFPGQPGMALGMAAGPGGMPTSAMAGSSLGGMVRPAPYHRGAEMGGIDQAFGNQQYVDMDRVISYDDGMFGTEYEGGGW
ncbi:hypothetical protein VD0004_g432 [Verticillium dahliae]|uniref:Zn(2)-C6 fungal-type domain-containing protein n=1 Tax=Verticillium dahliae TaxID=27337 RepID=A0A444RTY3_VERDA|nr:Putative beta-glucosidase I [Verticillium dahliae VDG2]PNH47926.1 hypothetical protein VD0004_g432 [Verticillium dahliae]PNH77085.1 hypothetical protein VD0001_g492 [Verticillium dahliae]RXG44596.1 hypothetical protein VDGE_05362 [Verticillium dahliae]